MSTTTARPAHNPSSYLSVRPDWLDRRHEEILEPALPIVDPHHHLWERPEWVYMFDDLLADTNSGHNIVATVFIQCHSMHRASGPEEMRPIGETEFVNGVAAMSASGGYGKTKICAGIVSFADLRLGARVKPVLEAHLRAGGDRFRGIRHSVTWDADPTVLNPATRATQGLMADRAFREGFSCLAPLGLTFEAWLYHPQIDELTALAQASPGTKIVLNHVGGPLAIGAYSGRRDEMFARWSASMRALAACPNVTVKLGGLGMRYIGLGFEREAEPPSSDALVAAWRPYMETCINAFGTARCMFESNFPVDKGSYNYPVFWNACKKLAHGASADDKTNLFSRTAARFYRLDLPG
jgi:predicted TIM-barrel fold metal-dependent hydrolase